MSEEESEITPHVGAHTFTAQPCNAPCCHQRRAKWADATLEPVRSKAVDSTRSRGWASQNNFTSCLRHLSSSPTCTHCAPAPLPNPSKKKLHQIHGRMALEMPLFKITSPVSGPWGLRTEEAQQQPALHLLEGRQCCVPHQSQAVFKTKDQPWNWGQEEEEKR